MKNIRTQIAIIGAGPSGLLLGQLLHRAGIDAIIIERQSAAHVLSRIRAGVIEEGTANLLDEAGCGARLRREGLVQEGFRIVYGGDHLRIDLKKFTGKTVIVYGQTEITKDLMDARAGAGLPTVYSAENVAVSGFDSAHPQVTYSKDGEDYTIECDFIAGCDGFHGVCRGSVPQDKIKQFSRSENIGWMGLLADTPPVAEEPIYATGEEGIVLCSMRSPTRSRYYIQCAADEKAENWSDGRFWAELTRRLVPHIVPRVVTGPSLEKSVAPLRSFVAEPVRFGKMLLAGDAAHIVPPAGAKGLNLAAADVKDLAAAFVAHYRGDASGIEGYSASVLERVWNAQRFCWWMTRMLHVFPGQGAFDRKLQRAEFDQLAASDAAQQALAENYAGPHYDAQSLARAGLRLIMAAH